MAVRFPVAAKQAQIITPPPPCLTVRADMLFAKRIIVKGHCSRSLVLCFLFFREDFSLYLQTIHAC